MTQTKLPPVDDLRVHIEDEPGTPCRLLWGIKFPIDELIADKNHRHNDYIGYCYVVRRDCRYQFKIRSTRQSRIGSIGTRWLPVLDYILDWIPRTGPLDKRIRTIYDAIKRQVLTENRHYNLELTKSPGDDSKTRYHSLWPDDVLKAGIWMAADAVVHDWFFRGGRG